MSDAVNGILLLDKPRGLSSNAALQKAKKLLKARKAGHTGSLDPMATGLLPLCFGEGTKVSKFLLEADKRYWTTLRLGQETTTGDAEGDVVESAPVELNEQRVREVLERFTGEIEQVPSIYSAIKQGGEPLYKKARRGEEVEEPKSRTVQIHELRLLSLDGEQLELDIRCSKGTYIRTLATDIGRALGCFAHLSELRRTASGPFRIEDAVALETLEEQSFEERRHRVLAVDAALSDFPAVELGETAAYYLLQGQPVMVPKAPEGQFLRLYDDSGKFLGVGATLADGRVAPKRLFHLP
ncbi:tRNA pseudouridine(55) synthase TruB [Thiohalorhabdus methylotrophus]|uniref:tRNA pseudouridine synthase B n=1 Tax=Thiohalorhabdus methylotrophus TaxID=3242694 RepID=A0ABV4TTV0_9GAMM